MKIGDKVFVRTTNNFGIIIDIDKDKIYVDFDNISCNRWIRAIHVEPASNRLKQTYMITTTNGDIEHHDEIQANNATNAILIWASKYICIEEVSTKNVTKLTKIEIQAFYSKPDGKFITSEIPTSKSRYIE